MLDAELDALLPELPAISIEGPRGVGKTATALQRALQALRLDDPAQAQLLDADPRRLGEGPYPILIDEWQRLPVAWDLVRRAVDDDPSGGRFLLTGSAPTGATHSGAARITTVRMRPLALSERIGTTLGVSLGALLSGESEIGGRCLLGLSDYTDEIVASGFPGMRHLTGRALTAQLDSYLDRIVDHDLPEIGLQLRRPATVLAWLRGYAAATATTAAWEKIRDAATAANGDKPAKTTTLPYIELLTALRILDPLPAWLPTHNHLSSLTEAPKHHLADPALASRLVRLGATKLLAGASPGALVPRDGTYLGALFESLAVLSVRTLAQRHDARVYHLRTRGGRHEVDMIVEGDGGFVGLEVKLSATVGDRDVAHLRWLRQQLPDQCADLVVLTTGPEAYRRKDGVAVVPLGLLVP